MNIILLIFSILPVFLIGCYIYNKDKNKESTGLIIRLLLGGLGSTILTIVISLIIELFLNIPITDPIIYTNIELIIYSFICIALIEEISKWIMLYRIGYKSIEYNEPYDMLLYGAFIGLGFACVENIIYVSTGGFETAITRALTAVPMHAMLGIIMGYFLNKQKENKHPQKNYKLLSLLIPMLIHGAYDYFLLLGIEITAIISICILIATFIYSIKLINKISENNQLESNSNKTITKYKEKYCTNCGNKYELNYCKICGRKRN